MRRVALAATLVVLVVLAAGCSSGGAADLDLGTVAPSPSPTEVVTTTTTSTVPSTEPPVVTAAPTTVAETAATNPPTTTTAPMSKEDQVRVDFEAARLARAQCTFDPGSCDYASIAIPGSPMDMRTREVVADRTKQNVRGKPGAGDVLVRVESVGFEGESAFVTVCTYDTAILYDIADPQNPDDDIVINDNMDSYRVRWELQLSNDKWLLFTNEGIDELHGGDLCGF